MMPVPKTLKPVLHSSLGKGGAQWLAEQKLNHGKKNVRPTHPPRGKKMLFYFLENMRNVRDGICIQET